MIISPPLTATHRPQAFGGKGDEKLKHKSLSSMAEITISDAELSDYPYIRAVLAYLDQTTTSQERFTARETDQAVDIPKSNLRDSLAERLRLSFKLRHTKEAPSPIGKELRHFRLYYPPDTADALSAAWCARQRGGSALAALQADYGEDCTRGVILRRENWPDPKRPGFFVDLSGSVLERPRTAG